MMINNVFPGNFGSPTYITGSAAGFPGELDLQYGDSTKLRFSCGDFTGYSGAQYYDASGNGPKQIFQATLNKLVFGDINANWNVTALQTYTGGQIGFYFGQDPYTTGNPLFTFSSDTGLRIFDAGGTLQVYMSSTGLFCADGQIIDNHGIIYNAANGVVTIDSNAFYNDNNGNIILKQQQAAVANATGAGDVVAQLNALLARLRSSTGHGLIAG